MTKVSLEELKKEIPEIFERVKKDVRRVWGRQRAGLSLEMGEMGMYKGGFIGGAHVAPGTSIVMNETALKELIKQHPYEIVWAYTYHILLHEYIHSFRVLDEQLCREITLRITEKVFKEEDHPAVVIARKGIGIFFPELKYAPPGLHPNGKQFEYIDNFDKESYEHYS